MMEKTVKWTCLGTSKFVYEETPHVKWKCENCDNIFRIPIDADYQFCPKCGNKIEKFDGFSVSN